MARLPIILQRGVGLGRGLAVVAVLFVLFLESHVQGAGEVATSPSTFLPASRPGKAGARCGGYLTKELLAALEGRVIGEGKDEGCSMLRALVTGDCCFCKKEYCLTHRLAEEHECPKLQEHLRKEKLAAQKRMLRESRGVRIRPESIVDMGWKTVSE